MPYAQASCGMFFNRNRSTITDEFMPSKTNTSQRSKSGYRVVNDSMESRGAHQDPKRHLYVITENAGYLAAITTRLIERDFDRRFKKHGSSFGQWPILIHLWAKDGQTQRELCRRVVVEEATMTNTLNRMVKAGLVERRQAPEDRRQQQIFLTRSALRLRDKMVAEALASNEVALKGVSARDRATLRRVLARIVVNLREQPSIAPSFSSRG